MASQRSAASSRRPRDRQREGTVAAAARRFVEAAPVMILALDVRGRPVAWNRECRRVTGFDLAALASGGWRALFPTGAAHKAWRRELARHRRAWFRDWKWDVRTRGGERRVLAWTSATGPPPDPAWASWAVGRDVTAQRLAENGLESEREKLRIAESVAGLGVWDFDPVTGCVRWSEAMERLYGLEPGRFGGTYADFLAFVHPDDRAAYERRYRESTAARVPVYEQEFRIVRRDGAVRWIHSRSVEVRDATGRLRRMIGVNLDVTRDRELECELRQKEGYLQAAIRNAGLVLFHQDRRLRYTWIANPGLGVTQEQLVGHTDEEILGSRAARGLTAVKREVLRTGRSRRRELWVRRGEQEGCYDLVVNPERDAAGRVVGVIGTALEVTDRARAQRELETTKTELQRLTGHLQTAVEEERRSIARDVHDQVGAVLTALRMSLANLAGRLNETGAEQPGALAGVQSLADQAIRSTRDICARLRPPALDELGLAETCRWYLRDWSRATGIRTRGRIADAAGPPPGPEVAIDLFRALQELLTNAARHGRAREVRVSLNNGPRGLRLRVADDGRGFEPGPASQRGLGLAGLRERAARHGGRLDVRSGPNGSTVTITLPGRDER